MSLFSKKNKMYLRKKVFARAYRETPLIESTNGTMPIGVIDNSCP